MAIYNKFSKEAQEILKIISKKFIMDVKEKLEVIKAVDDVIKEAKKWDKVKK